jgi:hypothetical protein
LEPGGTGKTAGFKTEVAKGDAGSGDRGILPRRGYQGHDIAEQVGHAFSFILQYARRFMKKRKLLDAFAQLVN